MSKFNRMAWGRHGGPEGWFLIVQKDNTEQTHNLLSTQQIRATEDRVFLCTTTTDTSGWGTAGTSHHIGGFISAFDMEANLIYEKVLGLPDADGYFLVSYRAEWMHPNPIDENNMLFATALTDDPPGSAWKFLLANIDSDGTIDHLVDCGVGNDLPSGDPTSVGGFEVCSNGDAWIVISGDDDIARTMLLDRSANYTTALFEYSIDAYGTSSNDYQSPITAILSDDSLIIAAPKLVPSTTAEMTISKITTLGTVISNETYVGSVPILSDAWCMCVDSADNIYLVWTSASTTNYISKFNSVLVEQWTVSISSAFTKGASLYPCKCVMSPDEAGLYVINGSTNVTDSNGMTIDPSDGSVDDTWKIEDRLITGSEEIICPVSIATNSRYVFLGMGWEASSGTENGVGILKVPQYVFDKDYVNLGNFKKTVWGASPPTTSSVTLTEASGATTKTAWAITQSDATGDLVLLSPDNPYLRELVVKAFGID